jgi:hypothetical protein
MTDDEKFLADFEACRLPLATWHHRDHLKIAYLYLRRYALEEAGTRVRTGIRAHNAAHNLPDLPMSGYHETMTQAWMHLVHFSLCEFGPAASADEFCDKNPQLSQKNLLRFFYTAEVFLSPLAKTEFLEPDVIPFPRSKKTYALEG